MKKWNFIDKTQWPERGPWDSEPDKAQWVDPATGLDCLMVRAHAHWCGYVGVPDTHPLFGKDSGFPYDHLPELSVHGGLTFAGSCQKDKREQGICHIPEVGRPDNVWWFGFDCAHSGDRRPATVQAILDIENKYRRLHDSEQYRDFDYVQHEVTELAAQIARAEAV